MLPITEIHEGDQFSNPLFVNDPIPGNVYVVEEVNKAEKIVKVQSYNPTKGKPIMKPFWKKSTDRIFSESWRYP
jgi:hypothetical protein